MQATSEGYMEASGAWNLSHSMEKATYAAEGGDPRPWKRPRAEDDAASPPAPPPLPAQPITQLPPGAQALAFAFSLYLETPSTRPTHGHRSVFNYEKLRPHETTKTMFPTPSCSEPHSPPGTLP